MSPENKEYVVVNEKDFWGKKTLELTTQWQILNTELRGIVNSKISDLNLKINNFYKNWLFEKWENSISEKEQKELSSKLKEIINWFNEEIRRIEEEYIWKVDKNKQKIEWEIQAFFWDNKSIYIEKSWTSIWQNNPNNKEALWEAGLVEKNKELHLT